MKIIEQEVRMLRNSNNVDHVARCASICYGSTPKSGESAEKFVEALIDNGHKSPLRHATYYLRIPVAKRGGYSDANDKAAEKFPWLEGMKCIDFGEAENFQSEYIKSTIKSVDYYSFSEWENSFDNWGEYSYVEPLDPYGKYLEEYYDVCPKYIIYAAVNGQTWYDNNMEDAYSEYLCEEEDVPLNIRRYTFEITTSIGLSRELNRMSPNNICEQSTRYVNLKDGVIIRPHWMDMKDAKNFMDIGMTGERIAQLYLSSAAKSFSTYALLIEDAEMRKEDARGILPLQTATKVVYTYSYREWQHFFDLRLRGITGRPHPAAKEVAAMIEKKLNENIGQRVC